MNEVLVELRRILVEAVGMGTESLDVPEMDETNLVFAGAIPVSANCSDYPGMGKVGTLVAPSADQADCKEVKYH